MSTRQCHGLCFELRRILPPFCAFHVKLTSFFVAFMGLKISTQKQQTRQKYVHPRRGTGLTSRISKISKYIPMCMCTTYIDYISVWKLYNINFQIRPICKYINQIAQFKHGEELFLQRNPVIHPFIGVHLIVKCN